MHGKMAAVIAAANDSIPVFSLAALSLFAERLHQGHHVASAAVHPGFTLAISNTATGMPAYLYDSGTWSCCTSKERDGETGLDFFAARYFSGGQGRFTSPDPVWVTPRRILDPQELNLYAYARNNPLRYVDPDGTVLELAAQNEEEARKRFALIQRGLAQQDRSYVQLVVGDGKNGLAKGHFGITADTDYNSKSATFQTIQGVANSEDFAVAAIVSPSDKFGAR